MNLVLHIALAVFLLTLLLGSFVVLVAVLLLDNAETDKMGLLLFNVLIHEGDYPLVFVPEHDILLQSQELGLLLLLDLFSDAEF